MSNLLISNPHDDVVVLTINRAHARKAVDQATASASASASAIAAAIDDFEQDSTLTVAVLTGSDGTFCSGMDIKAFADGAGIDTHRSLLGMTRRPPTKPITAAVEGWSHAGGCELALACDMIVAASDAKFGVPEVKRGIVAAAGGLARLPLALPHQLAMELAVTGEPFSAERAHQLGMVNRLTAPTHALSGALELAQLVARNGPMAVRTSKAIMSTASGWDDADFWEQQGQQVDAVFASHDAVEGATAFVEKRAPRWSGR